MVVVERLDVSQSSPSITCKFEMVYASLNSKRNSTVAETVIGNVLFIHPVATCFYDSIFNLSPTSIPSTKTKGLISLLFLTKDTYTFSFVDGYEESWGNEYFF